MFRIYKISNKINGKVYIGQTIYDVNKRFREHINKSKYETDIVRPLYLAMRKYGYDNFFVEELEIVETKDDANEREKYWIKYYNSFGENGYNATEGGDDGSYNAKSVLQISKKDYRVIQKFSSTHDAGRTFGKKNSIIQRVCSGERNSAYGYHWIYEDEYNFGVNLKERFSKKKSPRKGLQIEIKSGNILKKYKSTYDAGKILGIDYKKIYRVCTGERKSYKGYYWRFE